jgi:hypothetical protein
VLYERAKQLQGKGLSGAEIRQTLLSEGAREEDIKVILGSLGMGPQPQADPTPQPLAVAKRFLESRPARVATFLLGATLLGGFLYVIWIVVTAVGALLEGFTRGR